MLGAEAERYSSILIFNVGGRNVMLRSFFSTHNASGVLRSLIMAMTTTPLEFLGVRALRMRCERISPYSPVGPQSSSKVPKLYPAYFWRCCFQFGSAVQIAYAFS